MSRTPDDLTRLRSPITNCGWSWVRQVHGTELVEVRAPGAGAGKEADGLFTTAADCAIAVTTADCAPVVLVGSGGVAVVHAGWRGAAGGIIERAGAELRARGVEPTVSVLGPCIGPANYEFGVDDLATLRRRYGPGVEAETHDGRPALDLTVVVRRACVEAGWPEPERPPCTSHPDFHSHRTRRDQGRQTTVAWLEQP